MRAGGSPDDESPGQGQGPSIANRCRVSWRRLGDTPHMQNGQMAYRRAENGREARAGLRSAMLDADAVVNGVAVGVELEALVRDSAPRPLLLTRGVLMEAVHVASPEAVRGPASAAVAPRLAARGARRCARDVGPRVGLGVGGKVRPRLGRRVAAAAAGPARSPETDLARGRWWPEVLATFGAQRGRRVVVGRVAEAVDGGIIVLRACMAPRECVSSLEARAGGPLQASERAGAASRPASINLTVSTSEGACESLNLCRSSPGDGNFAAASN